MNRIRKFIQASPKRKLLIPFFTAGFPEWNISLVLVRTAADCGADFIEIGVPFSDPLADGPEIQHSSFIALKNKTSLKKILSGVERLRQSLSVPLILMGYYNPVLTYGLSSFMKDAKRAGVDGLIIPDLSIVEAGQYKREADASEISTTFLVSPTSSQERIKLIEKRCSDLVYAVTVTGVTGGGKKFDKETDRYLENLKLTLKKKFVAGFGVSSPETAARLASHSDGVVIGSKLVSIIKESKNSAQAVKSVAKLLKQIRRRLG
jgi:tryptophan synthase alpha chain